MASEPPAADSHRSRLSYSLLVAVTGVLSGVLGVGITLAIDGLQRVAFGAGPNLLAAAAAAPWWLKIAAPATGGAAVALLLHFGRRLENRTHGTSGTIEAVALRGGRLEALPAVFRELVPAICCVGTGGSLGREGPLIRCGALIGSLLGRAGRLDDRQVKTLVGCGAAAGMAAAYNAPVGAALFALEVILGNFALELFAPIVVASVASTAIARAIRGEQPVYDVPAFRLVSNAELPFHLLLGCVCGLASVAFVRSVRSGDPIFERWLRVPKPVRPIVGMALVGAVGIAFPEVYGNGFDVVANALHEKITPWWMLLVLVLVKVLATATTLGSGCPGGLFTPALLVGALLGGAYGQALHGLAPGLTSSPGAYALVGMAAITAGTSHAPVSALLMVFEMTGDYSFMLPLMLGSIGSALVARGLYPHSIYTDPLARRGIEIPARFEELVLAGRRVDELVRADEVRVAPGEPAQRVIDRLVEARRVHALVVDQSGTFRGAAALYDLLPLAGRGTAEEAIDRAFPRLELGERLSASVEKLARVDAERLPVVDAKGFLAGTLSKRALLGVYAEEILGSQGLLARLGEQDGPRLVELPGGVAVRETLAPPALHGQTLAQARLPEKAGVLVLMIERVTGGSVVRERPSAETRIEAGDRLVVLGTKRALDALGEEPGGEH